jgi:RimJ/RimL family protein N-acetyltransferase
MTNCGMVLEGVAKEQEKIKGKFMDIAHYGITKSMWEKI